MKQEIKQHYEEINLAQDFGAQNNFAKHYHEHQRNDLIDELDNE